MSRIAQLLIELLETLLVDILIPRAHEPVRGLVVLDLPLGGEQPVAHFAQTGAERVRGLFGGFRLHGQTHVVIRLSNAVRDWAAFSGLLLVAEISMMNVRSGRRITMR